MPSVPELFGSLVFNDRVMRERLPDDIYRALKNTVATGTPLDRSVANVVAEVMKDWAIEKGATHYTHWFQPLNGITAEKHDSFIEPTDDGAVIMNFSGKQLIKGEADASSFPSGGLRATFEARGYTAWDPSSYAFIKDHTLCIPTAFMSYTGQILDKKTPLLRSMNVLNREAVRLCRLFNPAVEKVTVTVGPEQEYFLVDRDMYYKRKDLIYTGRTLFGARPPKGQELEDHYYGNIRPRVFAFMEDLDAELWKLGIFAKTRHNEAAPAQHELAPVFTSLNVATDHNQLTMEVMRKVAEKHNLICLLHEKPFAGVNGSGKHNNWSMSADTGENLLDPGKNPAENTRFLLILAAVLKAVDLHQDLLRLSVATAGNDHRLGAAEAPPAIISVFLGDELTGILDSMSAGTAYAKKRGEKFTTGVDAIPKFSADTTDRNRTSPFAFTGNKFEFRMLGSSINISCPNVMINTSVADVLREFADKLESSRDLEKDARRLVVETYNAHKRIVFNGNNYSADWEREAERRGLLNLRTTPDALVMYDRPENIELFERYKIYTRAEIKAREEILLENYSKVIRIEGLAMAQIVSKQIIPAAVAYSSALARSAADKQTLGIDAQAERDLADKITRLINEAYTSLDRLNAAVAAPHIANAYECAVYHRDCVLETMQTLRVSCDELETVVAREYWPFPTYGDLMFY